MNTKNKIIAILMASIVAMATVVPMAIGVAPDTSAVVNNVAPVVKSVEVTPAPVLMNPCQSDTPIKVKATVTDNNSDVPDNMTVKITKLVVNSSGVNASGNVTGGLPETMVYNSTSEKYEATLNLKCCMPADTYKVTVNATDDGGLWHTNTSTFTVSGTTELSLNFNKTKYTGKPGEHNRSGTEYLGEAEVTNPQITSSGNDPTNVTIVASDLLNGAITIAAANMEASVGSSVDWKNVGTVKTWVTNLGCGDSTNTDSRLDIPTPQKAGTYNGTLTISAV